MIKKKVLMLASVASMIDQFNMPNIRLLLEMGYEVHVACNFEEGNTCSRSRVGLLKERLGRLGVRMYQIDFQRNVWRCAAHDKAYRELCRIFDQNTYAFVHCHSPVGGVLGRIAAHKYGIPALYTVHGFHFYPGAPVKNWLVYYPVEWLLSWWTKLLVTINREDYCLAKQHFHANKTVYVPGAGVDTALFGMGLEGRQEFSLADIGSSDTFVLLHVAELTKRKNQKIVLRALHQIEKCYPDQYDYQYLICGIGTEEKKLKAYVQKNGLSGKVRFLGYRSDIPRLLSMADACILSSSQEGLPVAVIEAMAAGLPVIVSQIRGNRELVDAQGGLLINADDAEGYAGAIMQMMRWKRRDPQKLRKMGAYNQKKSRKYDRSRIEVRMKAVYESMDGNVCMKAAYKSMDGNVCMKAAYEGMDGKQGNIRR